MTVPMLGGSYEIARGLMSLFNVRSYGAVGNGTVDDTAAIQRAVDAAAAATFGGVVYFPPGLYRVISPGVLITSSAFFEGAGHDVSVIFKDEGPGDFIGPIHNQATWPAYHPIEHISLRNLGFLGTGETDRTASTSSMLRLSAANVLVAHCSSSYARGGGFWIEQSSRVIFTDNRVYRSLADGIAVWSSHQVIIANNTVEGSNDDAISIHFSEYLAGPASGDAVITGNTITESQGINVVNSRSFVVTNNVLTRIMAAGIRLIANPNESTVFGGRVSGNVITDVIKRNEPNPGMQSHIGILVSGGEPIAATGVSVPGDPIVGTGVVTSLYGAAGGIGTLYQPATGASFGRPPGFGVEITDNILLRSLPAVTNVSEWGKAPDGLWVADNGDGTGFYNGAVTDAALAFYGIGIDAGLRDCRIERNHIRTGGVVAIEFRTAITADSRDFSGVRIVGNKVIDFSSIGIRLPQNATNHRILVQDNEIDADPLFKHSNRGANGTWLAGTFPVGIQSDTSSGALIEGNHFRNLAVYVTGNATTKFITFRDNYLYGTYAGLNFNVGNKGNGSIPPTGARGWVLIAEDSDPASATYGHILSDVSFAQSTIPTTGTYVRGHFVANTNPVQSAGKVLLGWTRLTSGSAHVLNTDWSALYATTT